MAVTDESIGMKLWADMKAQALGTANLAGPGQNQTELDRAEELLLWNKEVKGWTLEKEAALLAEGKTPAQVALDNTDLHRRKLIEAGPRALDKAAQFKYAADMARKADPTWTPSVPQGAQPPAVGVPEAPAPIESMVAPSDLSQIGG